MSDTSLRFDFLESRNTVIPAAGKTAAAIAAMDRSVRASSASMQRHSRVTTQEIFRIDNAMSSTARRFASRFLLIGGAIAAASGHAVAFTSSLWPMVGALAAVPAIAVSVGAGFAALITGFSGLGAALRKDDGGEKVDPYQMLAQSGKELVDTLKVLGPEWRKVQQATQQALLAGVADDLRRVSAEFLPVMARQLPAVASGWNNLFRSISAIATTRGFVDDIDASLGRMAVLWQRVGNAFGGFFSGFRHWTVVGSTFLPRLGSWVERMATRFDLWSLRMRESGKAFAWIENALVTGHKFNQLIGAWSASLFKLFQLGQDRALLDSLIAGSQAFSRWLDTAEGQQRITAMWEHMREVGSAAWRVIKEALTILSQLDVSPIAIALDALADVLGFVSRNMSAINVVLGPLLIGFVAYKVAMIGLNVVKRALIGTTVLFSAGLVAETAAVNANTAAQARNTTAGGRMANTMGRIERALGPLALLFIAGSVAGDVLANAFGVSDGPFRAATKNMNDLGDATNTTAQAYEAARASLNNFNDSIRAQTDPLFAHAQAQEQLNSAQERYNEAVAEFGDKSPQATQAAWDLAAAEQGMITATTRLATVNGPQTLQMLTDWYNQGLITKQTFDLLKGSIDAIPVFTEKTIRLTYQLGYHGNLSPSAALALSRSYGSDVHLLNMRAKGGPVSAGEPYVVGEEGPEVFVPGQSGMVHPNRATTGGPLAASHSHTVIEIRSGGSKMDDLLVEILRRSIRTRGGNVQVALGS